MAELKTQKNDASVEGFLNRVEHEQKRKDSFEILHMMREITGTEPKMWGDSIIGFGEYHYKYESGREGDWFIVGFSPRKQNISLYMTSGFKEREEILSRLGKHKTAKACLYINKLADVNVEVLKELIEKSFSQKHQGAC